ncbi:FAD-dependent oxidoreductase [Nocardioides sp. dk4132]|uniref:phytoene desaturase family protein n=1 Tax=unclassified Nocardioides TaxID=2615069 RepID=UPI0012970E51|nr:MULTISPECIES: NAD(P)/FAD-dependent oxidoreductase [unclassified Nocardioides]MQW76750.1 FAD-dependent oxidoreductase [Nocardioides sp. dk4132]QGA06894.1 FAD-dependent oxidoreductase [Nocardioides sp. dk884]
MSNAHPPRRQHYDVVVVGGGHNGLVSAAYLARAGLSVLVLERLDHVGGAAVSAQAFAGRDARLSRYSYLVSLMPTRLVEELGLDIALTSRTTASYTPWTRGGHSGGLLVERPEGPATRESFRALTGGEEEYAAWQRFYADVGTLAAAVAPTLMEPLPTERYVREQVDAGVWRDLVQRPLGETIEARFADDTVRGVVATDALIGTFASMRAESLEQNRCFLYHLVGNGTGEWRVPVGGMGAVTDALARSASEAGAEIITSAGVHAIRGGADGAEVTWDGDGQRRTVSAGHVLANVAPWVLQILLGEEADPETKPVGSQLKINLLLDRLPRLRSGADPAVAFAGTLHLSEDYSRLEAAYADAAAGRVPEVLPGEVYCHSLSDPSILGADAPAGTHTLTYFGLHTPAPLFTDDPGAKALAVARALASLDEHLAEPIASCLARDGEGNPCLEAKVPHEIEADLAMPGGHIFHGPLDWPWAPDRARLETPAQRWGVQTGLDSVLLCGSGARRGGAVSGLGGHDAARAVLESR